MAKVDILGVQHDYEITPSKQSSEITVVFVHGWLLSQQYWTPIIDCISEEFTCLKYDLRGFGKSKSGIPSIQDAKSSKPSGLETSIKTPSTALNQTSIADLAAARCHVSHYSPAAYGRDLLSLLKKLNIQRPWLVGHSLGGTIAIWAAAISAAQNSALNDGDRWPMIEGLICLNSGGGIYIHEDFEKFRTVGQQILKYRPAWLLSRIPGLDWIFSRSNVASPVDRRWGKQLLADFIQVNGEAGKRALLDSTTAEEVLYLPELVKNLPQPAFFIAGENDRVMEPRFVNYLASFHPLFSKGDSIIELPNCGHLGMIEQPQRVSDCILQMISKYGVSKAIKPEH